MTLCVFSPFYYSCSYKNPHSVILAGRRGSSGNDGKKDYHL